MSKRDDLALDFANEKIGSNHGWDELRKDYSECYKFGFDAAIEEVRKWAEDTDYCRPLDDFNRYALDSFLDELQGGKDEK